VIQVIHVPDIFATVDRSLVSSAPPGGLISSYAPTGFDCDANVVHVNGCRVFDDGELGAGDRVAFVEIPAGPLVAVAPLLITTVALTAGQFAMSVGQNFAPGVTPEIEREREAGSPSRGFNGINNTRGAGYVLSRAYGEHRTGGQIFDEFERPIVGAGEAELGQTVIERNDLAAGSKSTVFRRIAIAGGSNGGVSDVQFDDIGIDDIRGVTTWSKTGALTDGGDKQAPPAFDKAGIINPVDLDVDFGSPVEFTTLGDVDQVEMILRLPDGLWIREYGIVHGWAFEIRIEYKEDHASASYKTLTGADIRIRERAIQPLEYRVNFPQLARAPYKFRVTRVTTDLFPPPAPAVGAAHQRSAFKVKELVEYTIDRRSHPGVCELAVEHAITDIDTQLVPSRITSLLRGADDVRVYSDVSTYVEEWTANPAWCCADFIANEDWGTGRLFSYADIDIASFLEWAQYCDELVDDGKDGLEVRCRYDFVQDIQEDAQVIRNRIAFCGDAWVVLSGGKWRAVIDRAEASVDIFNDSNIEPGSLSYGYVPRLERANELLGHFANLELNYARDSLPIADDIAIAAGAKPVEDEVQCFGMTRPSQVARTCRRLVRANRLSDRRLSFKCGLEALSLTAGSVFSFASRWAGVGLDGGRVVELGAGGRRLVLDGFVELESGSTYEVIIRHTATNNRQTKTITTPAGRTETIDVGSDWAEELKTGDLYSVGKIGGSTQKFRCVSIDVNEDRVASVEARRYSDAIYTETPLSVPVSTPLTNVISPSSVPPAAIELTLLEHEPENSAGDTVKAIACGWNSPIGGTPSRWDVYYRLEVGEETWILAGSPTVRGFDIMPVKQGLEYRVAVVAVGPSGNALSIDDSAQETITISA